MYNMKDMFVDKAPLRYVPWPDLSVPCHLAFVATEDEAEASVCHFPEPENLLQMASLQLRDLVHDHQRVHGQEGRVAVIPVQVKCGMTCGKVDSVSVAGFQAGYVLVRECSKEHCAFAPQNFRDTAVK